MANVPDIGTGATISFTGDSAAEIFSAHLTSIEWTGATRSVGETTNLSTTGGRTYRGGDLYDPGELNVEMLWAKSQPYVAQLNNDSATCTVTFPLDTGEAVRAKFSGLAYLTSISGTIPLEGIMTAKATVKFTGDLTFTAAS